MEAPLVAERGLQHAWTSVFAACALSGGGSLALESRLNSCGAHA